MKLRTVILAVALALPAACVTNDTALQEAVSLSVSLGQHDDGIDIADATASLDERIAAAPDDPYVLKVAAMARANLASNAEDRATRVKLRQDALAQYDRAISLARPNAPPRIVRMNGQAMDIDLADLADLRAKLFATVQTDR